MATELNDKTALVVTTIAAPNQALRLLADGARQIGWDFIVVGDAKSPRDFELQGCRFFSVAAQLATGFSSADACPLNRYARKNIGYLLAARDGAKCIIETDDDNIPRPAFFSLRSRRCTVPISLGAGWVNVYRWFTDANICRAVSPSTPCTCQIPS